MKINTKIRYGLRMLLILAEHDDVINTSELGKRMNVSPKYLRKLAGPLEKSNLIRSVQGIYGGYTLNRAPDEISLLNLFEAFGEKLKFAECDRDKKCPLYEMCLARPIWSNLQQTMDTEMGKATLKNILQQSQKN